jgi:hypothetical protein
MTTRSDETLMANYLLDLGLLIREKAFEAKKNRDTSIGTTDYDYELGHLMAFYEIVSLMQQQAEAFGIPLSKISLENIDPDKDLL